MFDLLSRYTPTWCATLLTGFWFALVAWAIFFATIAEGANFRYWRM